MTEAERLAALYPRASWCENPQQVVDDYHRLAYDTERHASVTWHGHEMWKEPTDLVIYAEILHRVRPRLIIECGTFLSGSALFFAHQLDTLFPEGTGPAYVLTIDPWAGNPEAPRSAHPRIVYHQTSSLDPSAIRRAESLKASCDGPGARSEGAGGGVMVVLDSDHTAPHVLAEMNAYGPMVTPGSYLVVEDTNLNGHPVLPEWGPGPWEAVQEWLPAHPEFTPDEHCERFLLTASPGGWLRRS